MLLKQDHYGAEGEHDEDYDHDAFLGHDEAAEFENLSPEESMERLAKIVDRIDKVLLYVGLFTLHTT